MVYLPGNHDEALRRWIGGTFAGVRILHDAIHHTADGRRLLVIHGDDFDGICRDMKWLALLGSVAYDASLRLNTWLNMLRRWLGLGYWSLSGFLKNQVKAAVKFIDRYERSIAIEARRRARAGWSAATCTSPRSGPSKASSTATMATGWRAARRWSSIGTAASSWSTGRGSAASICRRCSRPALPAQGDGGRRLMRILLVTDAWAPQVNGVVRTLQRVQEECEALGHDVEVVSPDQFRTVPCPTYPEIRLACGRAADRRADRGLCARMRSTSRPRGRSASPRAGSA